MKRSIYFISLILLFLATSCATRSPLDKLKKELQQYPEYSIILEDMLEKGNFFKDYYHRYKVVYAEPAGVGDSLIYHNFITDLYKVGEGEYKKYYSYLGMVIVSKTRDGKVTDIPYPPGYQYVGDPRYGRWRQDSYGNSFWEFYGKYAFLNAMFNMYGRSIYRSDWEDYRSYRTRGEPYFGQNRQYGTFGQYTRQTHPTFFQRMQQKEAARKMRFSEKIKRRVKRSNMSGFRRRSIIGFGK